MKAVRYHSYGDSGVLVYEDADRPVAGPGQVVVKVAPSAGPWPTWPPFTTKPMPGGYPARPS